MPKKVLVVSFFFPPSRSAGVQRVLNAVKVLRAEGWEPIVLTAWPKVYEDIDESLIDAGFVEGKNLFRARAYDVKTTFSIKGKHFGWMTAIDRWSSWIPFAALLGSKVIRQTQPDIIWSSSPIPSSHLTACYLNKKFGIPWVADYRDPLSVHGARLEPIKYKAFRWVDRLTMARCSKAVFVTNKAKQAYQQAFPQRAPEDFLTIENGFDPHNWSRLENYSPQSPNPLSAEKFSMYYSGVLYGNGRDPAPLFRSLSQLKNAGKITAANFELVFQGAADSSAYDALIKQLDIADLVHFKPAVAYLDSLQFMLQAQVLVLIQDEVFRLQVPGKLYEYMRAGKPVLAMTPADTATAEVARGYSASVVTTDVTEIEQAIEKWMKELPPDQTADSVSHMSRDAKSHQILEVFEEVLGKMASLSRWDGPHND